MYGKFLLAVVTVLLLLPLSHAAPLGTVNIPLKEPVPYEVTVTVNLYNSPRTLLASKRVLQPPYKESVDVDFSNVDTSQIFVPYVELVSHLVAGDTRVYLSGLVPFLAQSCADGTPLGSCSATKPKFCQAGALINQCSTCGCPAGWTCRQDGSCTFLTSSRLTCKETQKLSGFLSCPQCPAGYAQVSCSPAFFLGYETTCTKNYTTACLTNAVCSGFDVLLSSETCAVCGNAVCDSTAGETCLSCRSDCGACPVPKVDLDANGQDSLIISSGSSANLIWVSQNVDACAASGAWTGAKATFGSEPTGAITAAKTYALSCSSQWGNASDSVTVSTTAQPVFCGDNVCNGAETCSACPQDCLCPIPSADIKANNLDILTVSSGSAAALSWSSQNTISCAASGSWSGSKPTTGSEATGVVTSQKTYILTCTSTSGTVTDSVTVFVAGVPSVDLKANNKDNVAVPPSTPVTLSWASSTVNTCTASGSWSGLKTTLGSETTAPLTVAQNFVLQCTGDVGSATDSVTVTVIYPPTVNIKANGQESLTLLAGNTAALSWNSTYAEQCTASNSWSGTKPTAGGESTPVLTTQQTYTLTCSGIGGTALDSVVVNVVYPPSVDILANNQDTITILSGTSAALTWSSAHADACTASGSWSGAKVTLGSQSTGAITSQKTYILTCTGAGGSAQDSVVVSVAGLPSADIKANNQDSLTAIKGESGVLSWATQNAATCTASGSWSGSKQTTGSQNTGPINTQQTYTLTCQGVVSGTAQDSVTISVALCPNNVCDAGESCLICAADCGSCPIPTADIKANNQDSLTVPAGTTVTLSWVAHNVNRCEASGTDDDDDDASGWSGTKQTTGSKSVGPVTETQTFVLTCTGTGGTAQDSVTVGVASPPAVNVKVNSQDSLTVSSGDSATLSWSSTNANTCEASGSWSGTKPASGSASTGGITSTQTYTLTCYNSVQQAASDSATINVNPSGGWQTLSCKSGWKQKEETCSHLSDCNSYCKSKYEPTYGSGNAQGHTEKDNECGWSWWWHNQCECEIKTTTTVTCSLNPSCPSDHPNLASQSSCTPKCSDGTPYGSCTSTKPQYCDNGALVNKAGSCGCPSGYAISGDNCVTVPDFSLTLERLSTTGATNSGCPVPKQSLFDSIDTSVYKKCVWDTRLAETGTDGAISIEQRVLSWQSLSPCSGSFCSGSQTKTTIQIQSDLGFSTIIPIDSSILWCNEWYALGKDFTWQITESITGSGKTKSQTFNC